MCHSAETLTDEPLCRRLAANARLTVQRFAIDTVVAHLLDAYHDLLDHHGQQRDRP